MKITDEDWRRAGLDTPRELGKRLRVTREEWMRLKLASIWPVDMTDEEIAAELKKRR